MSERDDLLIVTSDTDEVGPENVNRVVGYEYDLFKIPHHGSDWRDLDVPPDYDPGCAGPSEIDDMLDVGGCGGIDPEPVTAPKLALAPVGRLDRIARFFWSARTYVQVFEPARADLIHEWLEAEAAGEIWKSRWIRYVRGPYTVLSHMFFQAPVSICKRVIEVMRRIT